MRSGPTWPNAAPRSGSSQVPEAPAPLHTGSLSQFPRSDSRRRFREENDPGDLVVEKTGYPKDMLDLDLDLEADLGVDTVKQAEMFAAIREIYNIPRDENLKLRDYPDAGACDPVRVREAARLGCTVATGSANPQRLRSQPTPRRAHCRSSPRAAAVARTIPIKEKVLEIVAEKTGYPKDMLDLDLDLEADLGVDTVKQAEMFAAIRAIYNIPRDENLKLRDFPTLAHVIRFVYEQRPDLAARRSLRLQRRRSPAASSRHAAPACAQPQPRPGRLH